MALQSFAGNPPFEADSGSPLHCRTTPSRCDRIGSRERLAVNTVMRQHCSFVNFADGDPENVRDDAPCHNLLSAREPTKYPPAPGSELFQGHVRCSKDAREIPRMPVVAVGLRGTDKVETLDVRTTLRCVPGSGTIGASLSTVLSAIMDGDLSPGADQADRHKGGDIRGRWMQHTLWRLHSLQSNPSHTWEYGRRQGQRIEQHCRCSTCFRSTGRGHALRRSGQSSRRHSGLGVRGQQRGGGHTEPHGDSCRGKWCTGTGSSSSIAVSS